MHNETEQQKKPFLKRYNVVEIAGTVGIVVAVIAGLLITGDVRCLLGLTFILVLARFV